MKSAVDILNRRLGERLGFVRGGSLPRFAWKYAPDMPWIVYDRDDRTLLRKSWADAPAPDGKPLGRAWVLAEWTQNKAFDHMGFAQGTRVAVQQEYGYSPRFETALARGQAPNDEATASLIWVIDYQLSMSAEQREDSFEEYMGEEAYTAQRNNQRDATAHLEASRAEYDKYTGAFGNLEPGQVDGWMSWGGIGESPVVQKLNESSTEAPAA